MYKVINAEVNFNELIGLDGNKPITDTLKIAKAFNKQHKHVLRAIDSLKCSDEFRDAHFWTAEKINELGIFEQKQRFYKMDFSGFVMVVMGFTGEKATLVKEAYIDAFNWMAERLRNNRISYESERNAVLLEYMKEKDLASMAGRLLNCWGRQKKPTLLAKIKRLEEDAPLKLMN